MWNPRRVLDQYPESKNPCSGIRKIDGERCEQSHIFFSSSDIAEAGEILDFFATQDPQSIAVRNGLKRLAFVTLCPKWHQKEHVQKKHVEAVARRWQLILRRTEVEETNWRTPKRTVMPLTPPSSVEAVRRGPKTSMDVKPKDRGIVSPDISSCVP